MYLVTADYDDLTFFATLEEANTYTTEYFNKHPYSRNTLYTCEVLEAKQPVAPKVEIRTLNIEEIKKFRADCGCNEPGLTLAKTVAEVV